ncbi:MAG: PUA domain-containing protein [Pyrodictiaceae archaeon]
MRIRRPSASELKMLRGIADYQFGYPAGNVLITDDVLVGVSPATGRIREVYREGAGLFLVLRAHDYRFSLTIPAARMLLKAFRKPRLRAVIEPSMSPYKSVPCRAVLELDHRLEPGDEVIVVDSKDSIIGVGRLRLSPREILEPWCRGEAIRIRHKV